jgi:hypothetical protein
MKIRTHDGSIQFQRGTVSRNADRLTFLGSPLGHAPRRQNLVNKEWWHITVDPEPGVASTLLFRGDRLERVFLMLDHPSDAVGEWTEENELARKEIHDAWLLREIGRPPYEYPWGAITSEYDAKGCVSEIIVTYAK